MHHPTYPYRCNHLQQHPHDHPPLPGCDTPPANCCCYRRLSDQGKFDCSTEVGVEPDSSSFKYQSRNSFTKYFWGLGSEGHITRQGPITRRFGPSFIRQVYFLHKSTGFHDLWTECQIILINLLLVISHESPVIAKRCPLQYLLPNPHYPCICSLITPRFLPNFSPFKYCFSLPSNF